MKTIAAGQVEAGAGDNIFTAKRSVLGWPERLVKRVKLEVASGLVELERVGFYNLFGSSFAVYKGQDVQLLIWWKGEK